MTQSLEALAANIDAPIESFAGEQEIETPDLQQVVDDVVPQDDAPQLTEAEIKARQFGWKPQEDFKGDPTKWKSAEEFAKERENKIDELQGAIKRMEQAQQTIIDHQQRELERTRQEAYDKAVIDVNTRLADAIQNQDMDAVQNLIQARDNLVRVDESKRYTPVQEDVVTTVNSWKQTNQWFEQDPDLTRYAKAYELELAQQNIPLQRRLEMTTQKVKETFAYKFQRTPGMAQNMTLATQQKAAVKRQAAPNSYEALAPSWRKECDIFVNSMSARVKPEVARAEYLKNLPADAFNN